MYSYEWDAETGGFLLNSTPLKFSKEPRPVYYKELDILGFDKHWNYAKDDTYPYMWAESNTYWYRGRKVAQTKGGALYTAPELVLLEDPEPNGEPLRFVDISAMVEKNREIMESLVQNTIKKVYNTYIKYKDRVDVFYVAFSGGKDSVVTLDIVQRALPHNDFKVLFGDTGMEFPDTYDVVKKVAGLCKEQGIEFLTAHSELEPEYTWNKIGPPAQRMRWCCSVHKTAPQILLLRKLMKNPHFRGMAMMGVRSDESTQRSRYAEINLGKKHKGQYDYYPIFEWNSAELFLYIYQQNLVFNETYKSGNSRAGCLVCPMEASKNAWFKAQAYSKNEHGMKTTTLFNDIIYNTTIANQLPEKNVTEFMEIGVWKSRHNGSKLSNARVSYSDEYKSGVLTITLFDTSVNWREWLKTIGEITYLDNGDIEIFSKDIVYKMQHKTVGRINTFAVYVPGNSRKEIYFMSALKNVFRKSAYCITCQVCEANCPNGYIRMCNGEVTIDDRCTKCQMCHKIDSGCLVAASQLLPKEGNRMNKSVDRYKNMGIKYPWVKQYFAKKDLFWEDNDLGSMMETVLKAFLADCQITKKNKITPFGNFVVAMGVDSVNAWALMLCNLVYTAQFNWWAKNIKYNTVYTEDQIRLMLDEVVNSPNSKKNIVSGFKFIFSSNPILSDEIGFGICRCKTKGKNLVLVEATRSPWKFPEPLVILYSLYKFAEACGGYYEFTLRRLLDHEVESDGVSPTQIFGLDEDQMKKILGGLSVNYPDFIHISFTLDLDNITLRSEKTSADVLELFE